MTEGLSCTCHMPLAWRPASLSEGERLGLMREAALLLAALNQMESAHELDSGSPENRRLERLEAKLDLALHLLARTLEPVSAPSGKVVTLTPQGAEWDDAAPPADGTTVILEIRPSDHLPLTLKLPAVAREPLAGRGRVRFENLSEALDDALCQFVFRRHRQAIRSRTA